MNLGFWINNVVFILVMIFEGVWEIAQQVYMCYVDLGILQGMPVVVLGIRTVFIWSSYLVPVKP